jgi:glycosyltransferase involved in cell wall biosynthesis
LSKDFAIVPNAGLAPLEQCLSVPDGPFVYCGSITDGKNLAGIIQAARDTRVPLKIIGGTDEEWRMLSDQLDTSAVAWQPYLSPQELPEALAGARAGLIATNPDTAAGEFSCPLKLFDYAGCGLPVISTTLPSLQSLDVGPWCTQIPSPARIAWVEALRNFRHDAGQAEAARTWSAEHTWGTRAELLKRAFGV